MKEYVPMKHDDLYKLYHPIYPTPPAPGHHTVCDENNTRMKRALSWLNRCETNSPHEDDARFLFLWIAFNAAHGADENANPGRSDSVAAFKKFLGVIVDFDQDKNRLASIALNQKEAFEETMADRFLFQQFWAAEYPRINTRTKRPKKHWHEQFCNENEQMHEKLHGECLSKNQTKHVFRHVFARLYTLRNQIIHGCATWRSKYNPRSLEHGNTILGLCIPVFLEIMLDALKDQKDMDDWGRVSYPPYLAEPDEDDPQPPRREEQHLLRLPHQTKLKPPCNPTG
ncbi:MAG: HEPN domain-containing protein [Gammaproteobacteria bacterium]